MVYRVHCYCTPLHDNVLQRREQKIQKNMLLILQYSNNRLHLTDNISYDYTYNWTATVRNNNNAHLDTTTSHNGDTFNIADIKTTSRSSAQLNAFHNSKRLQSSSNFFIPKKTPNNDILKAYYSHANTPTTNWLHDHDRGRLSQQSDHVWYL